MIQICRAEDGHVFQVSSCQVCAVSLTESMGGRSTRLSETQRGNYQSRRHMSSKINIIDRTGSLELFLHQETGVDEEAILAYLSDGRRLRNDNIRELAGAQDQVCAFSNENSANLILWQSIFVFNKYYLDFDLDEVLHELRVEPPLQPPIEGKYNRIRL